MTSLHTAIAFEAFGARIGIRTDESVASDLRPHLPPRARPITTEDYHTVYAVKTIPPRSSSDHTRYQLTRDGVAIGSFRSLSDVCRELESDMHFRVALAARDFLFVHAGVVQWKGRAVVVPGRTETGKSSLVMALVNAGSEYFSDEYAVLDREVALALLKTEGMDELDSERIVREGQTMARLGEHPNVMPIYDLGYDNDTPYIVMPLMSGGSVESLRLSSEN